MICFSCSGSFEVREYLDHRAACRQGAWGEHLKAVDSGRMGRAGRLAREALGVQREVVPMPAGVRARLNTPAAKAAARAKREEKRQYKDGVRAMRADLARRGRIRRRVLA